MCEAFFELFKEEIAAKVAAAEEVIRSESENKIRESETKIRESETKIRELEAEIARLKKLV